MILEPCAKNDAEPQEKIPAAPRMFIRKYLLRQRAEKSGFCRPLFRVKLLSARNVHFASRSHGGLSAPPLCTFILSRRNRAVKRYFIKKPIPRPLKCAARPIKVDKRVFFLYTIPVNYSGETKKRRRRCNPHAVRLSLRQRGQSGFISLGRFRAAFFFGIRRTNVIR